MRDAVVVQVFLELGDLLEPAGNEVLGKAALGHFEAFVQLEHLHRQHVLVMGTVEDGDLAPGGQAFDDAPQVIVGQLLGAGLLKGIDPHPLGVDPRHHMLDGGILARRVHGLQHDDQALPAAGVQPFLQPGDLLHVFLRALHQLVLHGPHLAVRAGGRLTERQRRFAVIPVILGFHTSHPSFQNTFKV